MIYRDLEYALAFAFTRGSISNTEFALFRDTRNEWSAEAGNPSHAVRLGETSGEVEASGTTVEEAVRNMIKALEAAPKLSRSESLSEGTDCEVCGEAIAKAAISAPKLQTMDRNSAPTVIEGSRITTDNINVTGVRILQTGYAHTERDLQEDLEAMRSSGRFSEADLERYADFARNTGAYQSDQFKETVSERFNALANSMSELAEKIIEAVRAGR